MAFVYLSPKSELTFERWQNMLESKIYQRSLISVVVDEVHIVLPNGAVQATTRSFSFSSFLCVVFS